MLRVVSLPGPTGDSPTCIVVAILVVRLVPALASEAGPEVVVIEVHGVILVLEYLHAGGSRADTLLAVGCGGTGYRLME